MQNIESRADDIHKRNLIVWGSLLMSQAMFCVVVLAIAPGLWPPTLSANDLAGEKPIITGVLAFLAFDAAVASFILSKIMYRRAAAEAKPAMVQSGLVIACALSEFVSISGVVLAIVFHYRPFYLWIAAGAFLILLHFPSRQRVLDAMRPTV